MFVSAIVFKFFPFEVGRGLFFFLAALLSKNSKVLFIASVDIDIMNNTSSSKGIAKVGASWSYRALRVDASFIRRMSFTVEFSASR